MADTGSAKMAKAADGKTAKAEDRLISIGRLVHELQSEFPDLSISKVRYLEDRGLLSPQRTKGKYRKYSTNDARRLRGILAMQRDEYLPLDVIRKRMDAKTSSHTGGVEAECYPPTATITLGAETPTYTLEEVTEILGVDEEFIQGLVEFRLVEQAADSGPAFTEGDIDAARICQRLRHFNVEPRHLRLLSSSAEREAGLVEQIATPDLRSGHADRKEYGLETVQELGSLLAQLDRLLLTRELRRIV